jgi:hypothetical protein
LYHFSFHPFVTFRNKMVFYGEELLAPCPSPKLDDHHLSSFHDYLFNIFSALNLELGIWTKFCPHRFVKIPALQNAQTHFFFLKTTCSSYQKLMLDIKHECITV